MEYKKKLIEVALPLEAINRESAREKSIRHGHPSTLHLWWSRKPLATARAVLFASLVDDPSAHPDKFPTEEEQEKERQRLFGIIEELVKWENTNNEEVLNKAREEILKSTGGNLPPFYDPFCGGGSIPLEAQRLGLDSYASDLNPVAVLITKALIEIPPKFANMPPVNSVARSKLDFKNGWKGASGLAEDVRYYGKWMRDEAFKRIGHLYPKVKLPKEYGSREATVIAWIWCRTVKCPNPACGAEMPLTSKFGLSSKRGTKAWIEPVVNKNEIEFIVKTGNGTAKDGTVNRSGAKCICCGTPVSFDYIRSEGKAGRLGKRLMGIVVEGERGRYYLPPNQEHESIANQAIPSNVPETDLPEQALGFRVQLYGMTKHADLFTNRQLTALTTFSDIVSEVKLKAYKDAISAGLPDDQLGINEGGKGAKAYSEAIATYLALAVDRLANRLSTLCVWNTAGEKIEQTFTRQALPLIWNFAEANVFSDSTGSWSGSLEWIPKVLENLAFSAIGEVYLKSATEQIDRPTMPLISTDPPYYDNIGYADLSDYFYIWLRESLSSVYPDLFRTMLVPKAEEIIYSPYRFENDSEKAKEFFENNLAKAFINIKNMVNNEFPVTVYYAFKQSEEDNTDDENETTISSTGWETMLTGLIKAGFMITGTWPTRTERKGGLRNYNQNALASSIVLVCRPRPDDAKLITRREFVNNLRKELHQALKKLHQGNIAPVDLAQAAIGPGMSVFSRYSKVLEADGNPMTVRTALQIINQELDAYLTAQEGEMDTDSRFCVAWYEQFGMNEAPFGEADVLARAKNTSVGRLEEKGVVYSAKGKVRLLKREELDVKWSPVSPSSGDMVWMCTQQLVKALENKGEIKTAELVYEMRGDIAENAKALAYRLYTIAERKGWTEEAYAYNALVVSWPDIQRKAEELAARSYEQQTLF